MAWNSGFVLNNCPDDAQAAIRSPSVQPTKPPSRTADSRRTLPPGA